METSLVQTFVNEEFGELRILQMDNEFLFHAGDACRILDLKDVTSALRKLDDDEKMLINLNEVSTNDSAKFAESKNIKGHSGKRGGAQFWNFVTEAGLYRLIFMSRKPEAKKIQRWIFHEVIPQIRKTGGYSANSINPFPPELSERWADVKGAEILVKASKITSNSKFREHLIKQAHLMITGTDFIENHEDNT